MKKLILLFSIFSLAFNAQSQIDLRLNSNILIKPTPVEFQGEITVNTKVFNNGQQDFTGDLTAAIFAQDSTSLLFFIEIKSGVTIKVGEGLDLQFYSAGLDTLMPTYHYIKIMYQTTGIPWQDVSNTSQYKNFGYFYVSTRSSVSLYKDIQSNYGPLYQGIEASFSISMGNYSQDTFNGGFRMSLYSLKGRYEETISTSNISGLPKNYVADITFPANVIQSKPGNYFLALEYSINGIDWFFTDNGAFYMCYEILVQETPIADQYEPNNSSATAYPFTLNFIGDTAKIKTEGANYHKINEADYYKITAPFDNTEGYDVYPTIYDVRYNNYIYTAYASLVYSLDGGSTFSPERTWDKTDPIHLEAGKTILFYLAKRTYNPGNYDFIVNVVKSKTSSVKNIDKQSFHVFPNPANDVLNIDLKELNNQVRKIELTDIQGSIILTETNLHFGKNTISLNEINAGIYLINIYTNETVLTEKIIIKK